MRRNWQPLLEGRLDRRLQRPYPGLAPGPARDDDRETAGKDFDDVSYFQNLNLCLSLAETDRRSFSDDADLNAYRIKRVVANFEKDTRKRAPRRPGQRPAGLQVE